MMLQKIVAMIPARLGSKRVKNKNLRLLNNKELVRYPIEAAIKSGKFDAIYLNSEAEEFRDIAIEYGINFYKRPEELATDSATNDIFMADFMENVKADIVVQLLPTSPFIDAPIIQKFVESMVKNRFQTLISVKDVKIECLYKTEPVNFSKLDITLPSQLLEPVKAYACGIMGWDVVTYQDNMLKYNAAYHGGDAKTGTFTIKGYSTVDIDEEEDFLLAEVIAQTIQKQTIVAPPEKVEVHVPSILAKDGVVHNNLQDANKLLVTIQHIIDSKPKDVSWSHRIINTPTGSATLICQLPGESNRKHYHDTVDEWWHILQGSYEFEVDTIKFIAKQGDIVCVEKLRVHKITAVGDLPAIRFAVSHEDAKHIYVD